MIRLVGGRVIDPASGRDEVADVLIDQGQLIDRAHSNGETVIDVSGYIVAPGFVDLHCHLREPGFEDAETIATGTHAAAAGGFTTVCALADTQPTTDTGSDVESLLTMARRDAVVRLLPVGTTTKRREVSELSEMADMAGAGAVAFSDDGRAIRSASLMRHALEYSLLVERPISSHAEDPDLVDGGVMHEGALATVLGLKGIPREAEEVAVARDLALARLTGGPLHLAHLSTAGAVQQVRQAKASGVRVTAEVAPHNLLLSDSALTLKPYDSNARTDPPLRSEDDARALVEGLLDGTIDCIASDHSPRRWVDKACEFKGRTRRWAARHCAARYCSPSLRATSRTGTDCDQRRSCAGARRRLGLRGGGIRRICRRRGRGGLQHRHHRLPGSGDGPVVSRPDGGDDPPANR